jgi:hypothetical protein
VVIPILVKRGSLNYHDSERRELVKLFHIFMLSHIVTITLKMSKLYELIMSVRNNSNNNTNNNIKTRIIRIHFFINVLTQQPNDQLQSQH